MSASNRIPFEGVLNCWNDEHDLPDLLLAICRSRKTGRLSFSNPEGDKILHIRDGKVVFAESSSGDDGLGHYLLRTGKISLMDYLRVSKLVEPGKRLGALLVAEEVIDAKELVPAVKGQVRSIIVGLFRRTETWYRFKEETLAAEAVTLDLPVETLVLEGVRHVDSWRRISKGVGHLESVYRRVDAKQSEWDRLALPGVVQELFEMLEEPVSVAHICTHATMPDFEACRYLWAFRCLDWIEPASASKALGEEVSDAAEPSLADVVTQPSVDPAEPEREPEPEPALAPPPPPIPQKLIETRIALDPPTAQEAKIAEPKAAETHLSVEPPAAKPVPAPLAQTNLAVDPPTPGSPSASAPSEPKEPAPIPKDLERTNLAVQPQSPPPARPSSAEQKPAANSAKPPTPAAVETQAREAPSPAHTQLFIDPPAPEPPEPPSTGEMMEAILSEESSPNLSPPQPPPPSPSSPSSPEAPPAGMDNTSTHFFDSKTAYSESHSDGAPAGFEALAFDDDSDPSLSAIQDISLPNVHARARERNEAPAASPVPPPTVPSVPSVAPSRSEAPVPESPTPTAAPPPQPLDVPPQPRVVPPALEKEREPEPELAFEEEDALASFQDLAYEPVQEPVPEPLVEAIVADEADAAPLPVVDAQPEEPPIVVPPPPPPRKRQPDEAFDLDNDGLSHLLTPKD